MPVTAQVDTAGAITGLDAVFRARSIALVGISADTRKMTGAPLEILRQVGFTGPVYPVDPRYRDVGGLPCFPDIDALPASPDDINGLVDAALAFSASFVAARPEATEMELNPVFVRAPGGAGGSVVAVDMLVKFSGA